MLKYWLWLTTREGLSKRSIKKILMHFPTPREAMFADREAYEQIPELTASERRALEDKDLRLPESILETCEKENIHILTYHDAAYPERLAQLADAPAVLYWKGRLPAFDSLPAVGVVGTRQATAYGLQNAKRLGYQIGEAGGVVVSGMAKGIDALATQGCLSAGQLAVGVLGCGVDIVYPWENKSLFRDMEDHGCLISEFTPGSPPTGTNFPIRNRIISGLSLGVLVVEAPEKSGAMITARLALDQGRDVFAVPGPIDSEAFVGSNSLIQQGAKLVTSGWDVLEEYVHLFPDRLSPGEHGREMQLSARELEDSGGGVGAGKTGRNSGASGRKNGDAPASFDKKDIDKQKNTPYSGLESVITELTADERALAYHLLDGPLQADELAERTGLPAGRVMAAMTLLQIRGAARQMSGKVFALTDSADET